MTKSEGQIENFINNKTYTITDEDKKLGIEIQKILTDITNKTLRYDWAGSIARKTAVEGSDLDILIHIDDAILTKPQRIKLSEKLKTRTDLSIKNTIISSHSVTIERHKKRPTIDISFSGATFGSRQKTLNEIQYKPGQKSAVKLMKLWIYHHPHLPKVKGWVIESLINSLNQQQHQLSTLQLFQKTLDWLIHGANVSSIESILRPLNQSGEWSAAWSSSLSGKLSALQNDARRIQRHDLTTAPLLDEAAVAAWLWP
jgi:predicted nucleotidyltransferase